MPFLLAYYKYDVALASLLSTCGMPERLLADIAVPDKLRTLYSENNKKRKQYGKREETVRSRFIVVLVAIVMVSAIGIIAMSDKPVVLQGQIEATEIRISGKLPRSN